MKKNAPCYGLTPFRQADQTISALARKGLELLVMVPLLMASISHAGNIIAWGNGSQTNVPPSATNAVAVAAGHAHSLALRADGTVVSWGSLTNVLSSATNLAGIAAGYSHSLGLRQDGTVVAWGDNTFGQTTVPAGATNVMAIAAGDYHNLALRADGVVVYWGRSGYLTPNLPAGYTSNIVLMAAAGENSRLMRSDGSVISWGGYSTSTSMGPTPIFRFTRGIVSLCTIPLITNYSLALTGNGRVSTADFRPGPVWVTNAVMIAEATGFALVAPYNLALNANGRVLAWGDRFAPTNIPPTVTNIVAIAAGPTHCLVVKDDGIAPRLLGPIAYGTTAAAGNPLPLSARAIGSQPLSYYWLADGVPLSGKDGAFAQIPAVPGNDNVGYQVIVSNAFGAVTSEVARVTVWPINIWGRERSALSIIPASVTNPVAVAAGGYHSLALNRNGSVVGWGKNADGQTNVPPTAANIAAIAAGGDHSLAVRSDGSLIAWGRSFDGQTNVPAAATNVVAVAAGKSHSLALRVDGTVLAWGSDEYGQTDVSFLATEVTAISAGYYHSMALRSDGTVTTWGWDVPLPAGATNVQAIAAGWEHCLALRGDGSVIAWGDNTFGQSSVPHFATNVVAIAAGWYHNVAALADGSVVAWGRGYGTITNVPAGLSNVAKLLAGEDYTMTLIGSGLPQFGLPLSVVANAGGFVTLNASFVTTRPASFQWFHNGSPVAGATNSLLVVTCTQVADGGSYTLRVVNSSGQASSQPLQLTVLPNSATITTVGGWGDDRDGQLDVSHAVNAPRAVAAGPAHGLALNADGTVAAWGKNWDGQTTVPPAATNVVAIAAGGGHNLALRSDGSVLAWGRGKEGQTNLPPQATNVAAVAAGVAHSLTLLQDGTVLAWGDNYYGQTNVPPAATNIIAISAGYNHNLVLRSDHSLLAWGAEDDVPLAASNVVAMAGGWTHSLAVRADGSVVAWGDNAHGQCDVPTSASNVVAVSAGWYNSVAVRADGTVIVWGRDPFGMTNLPVGLRNVATVAAGADFVLALVDTGPPRFSQQPAAAVAHPGAQVMLNARSEGTSPLVPAWLHDSLVLTNAKRGILFLTNVQPADAGDYTLTVSNAIAVTDSLVAPLIVSPDPALGAISVDQNVLLGSSVVLPSLASGLEPLSYQWQRDGINLVNGAGVSGATSPVLSLEAAGYDDSGSYSLVASNGWGMITGLVSRLSVSPIVAWGDHSAGQLSIPVGVKEVVTIAANGEHSLALQADGRVVAWGDNSYGQNNVPPDAVNATAIADGPAHSLALRADGTVIAWGDNSGGQTNVPSFPSSAVAVAAGRYHSLALMLDGTVAAWGSNTFGQATIPAGLSNVVAIAAGDFCNLALRADGQVVAWGSVPAIPPSATNVTAIAAGATHALALRADGVVVGVCRYNYYGQGTAPAFVTNAIGIAAGGDHSLAVLADGSIAAWGADYEGLGAVPASTTNAVAIAAGESHSLALVRAGSLGPLDGRRSYTVAVGMKAVLGAGFTMALPPGGYWTHDGALIAGAAGRFLILTNVQTADAGDYTWVNVSSTGVTNQFSVHLDVMRSPVIAQAPSPAVAFMGGPLCLTALVFGERPLGYQWTRDAAPLVDDEHLTGTTSSGLCLTAARNGDAGDYSLIVTNQFGATTGLVAHVWVTPVAVWGSAKQVDVPSSATNIVALAAGDNAVASNHRLALRRDGSVVAWGLNASGQCNVPESATNVVAIAAGSIHSLALNADGTVTAWGYNGSGQANVPLAVTNAVAVAAAGNNSMALRSDGSALVWGDNFYGQTNVPSAATNLVAIALGTGHCLGLRVDGAVVGWGANGYGQTNIPSDATNVLAIAAGSQQSLALRADGHLIGWGYNGYGQTNVPATATNVIAMAVAVWHNMVLRSDDSITAWGSNPYGQTNIPASLTNVLAINAASGYSMALVSETGQRALFQPPRRQIAVGESTEFVADTPIRGAAEYQWQLNGVNILGATNRSLSMPNVNWTDAGIYRVVISSAAGLTTGRPMVLSVARAQLRFDTSASGIQLNNDALRFRVLGASGLGPVILFASTNLVTWDPIRTNAPAIGTVEFINVPLDRRLQQFYRAAENTPP